MLFAGKASFPIVNTPVVTSPTIEDDGVNEHAIVLGVIVAIPVFAKFDPETAALTKKLLA